MADLLMEVQNLSKSYMVKSGLRIRKRLTPVDGVSLEIKAGQTVGLVGESGCGKSTTAELLVGLRKPDRGIILYRGKDLWSLTKAEWHAFHREVQIVFQNPFDSLNPLFKVRDLVAEPLRLHKLVGTAQELEQRVLAALQDVGLSEDYAERQTWELSGGQCQRVAIARALVLRPKLIICDEIVSALDVSVQAQILHLLKQLQEVYGVSYLFISHDLDVVRHVCDEVLVMFQGKIVEQGPVGRVFAEPVDAYAKQLLGSIPRRPAMSVI
ncbi:MAG: ATP-binding cassette domain-containing protein [Desulfitobacteriaceae bacterium]